MRGRVPQEPFRRLRLDDQIRPDGEFRHLIDALLHFLHGPEFFALRLVQRFEFLRVVINRELAAGQFVFRVVLVDLGQRKLADRHSFGLCLGISRKVLTEVLPVGDQVLLPAPGLADGAVAPHDHGGGRDVVVRPELDRPVVGFCRGDGQVVPVFGERQSIAPEIPFREDAVLVGHRRLVLFGGGVIFQRERLRKTAVLVHEGRAEQFRFHLLLDIRHLVVDVRADRVPVRHEPVDRHVTARHRQPVEVRVPLPDDGLPDEELGRPVLGELCPAAAVLRDPGVQVAGAVVAVVQDGGDEFSLPLTAECSVPGELASEEVHGVPLLGQGISRMQAGRRFQTVDGVAGVIVVEDLDREIRLHMDGPPVHEFQFGMAPARVGICVVGAAWDIGDLHRDGLGRQCSQPGHAGPDDQHDREQRGEDPGPQMVCFQ